MLEPLVGLEAPLVGLAVAAILLENHLFDHEDVLGVLANLLPVKGDAEVPLPNGVVLVVHNVEMLKVHLKLADVVTDVDPLFIFVSPVELTILANHVLRILVILDGSHLEFTDNFTVVDVPMAPHLSEFLIDLTIVLDHVAFVLLLKGDSCTVNGTLNREAAAVVIAGALNGFAIDLHGFENHLTLVIFLVVVARPLASAHIHTNINY